MLKSRVLIVDDDTEIRDMIEIYLKTDEFDVVKASNGIEALDVLQNSEVHLIILDIMMPEMDGIRTCLKIREQMSIPIILLSAKNRDNDKILGLGVGADDYVTKPFNPLELMARIKAQIRRYTKLNSPNTKVENLIEIDDLKLDTKSHEVTKNGVKINLTPTEFDILKVLALNRGIVLSIDKIYEMVWNEPLYGANNLVMVHIRKLREKIEANPGEPRYIKTVWGVGYKIEK